MTEIQGAPAGTQTGANGRYTLVVNSDGSINTSGGGGGGGAVTVADGADVAQGTTTDASSALTVIGLLKNLKAALAGTLTVASHAVTNAGTFAVQASSVTLPTGTASIGDGRQVVTTAGTAVQFASNACKQATITALSTNTGIVVIGASTVVAAAGTRRGCALAAGDAVTLDVSNTNLCYIDSTVNGEGASFLWEA